MGTSRDDHGCKNAIKNWRPVIRTALTYTLPIIILNTYQLSRIFESALVPDSILLCSSAITYNVDLDSGLMIGHWCLMPLSPHDAWLTNVLGHQKFPSMFKILCPCHDVWCHCHLMMHDWPMSWDIMGHTTVCMWSVKCVPGTQWDNGLNGLITAKVTNMSELESLVCSVCSIQKFPSMIKILCPCHDVWSMEYLPATQCSS